MKFLSIIALLLAVYLAYSSAQECRQEPREPKCVGARNLGHRGRFCQARTMWHYNTRTRQCQEMPYLGCAGNDNRWCSKRSCERRCSRR